MSQKINYKSDFDFILNLAMCVKREDGVCEKTPLGWPDFDWSATLWTSNKANAYVASRHGDSLVNCFEDNGKIHIVVNNHHLGKGELSVEFHALLPDGIYPDSVRDTYDPQPLDIELVAGSGDCVTQAEAELMLPMLKGDKGEPFTYEDFTAEQLAGIRKPAIDAAERADEATANANKAAANASDATYYAREAAKDANEAASKAEGVKEQTEQINKDVATAEQSRAKAEDARQIAEQSRKDAETVREANEEARKSAESQRQRAETLREIAERDRDAAEVSRAEDETLRKSNEQGRIDNESQRNANESQRKANETARQSAEQQRVTEFTQIKQEAQTATANANQAAEAANAAAAEIPENIVTANPADNELEEIEPNIVTNALRKTEQLLTDGEKAQVLKNLGNPEFKLFVDMWNSRGDYNIYSSNNKDYLVFAKYDPDNAPDLEHPFYINELWLTYDEAVDVMNCPDTASQSMAKVKTLFPEKRSTSNSIQSIYALCHNIEKIRLVDYYIINNRGVPNTTLQRTTNTRNAFYRCINLNEVIGIIQIIQDVFGTHFYNVGLLPNLETIWVHSIMYSFTFNAPKLKLECWKYMIENAVNTSTITITVPLDVYAKLTDETNEEWNALLTLAASKNIQFATA